MLNRIRKKYNIFLIINEIRNKKGELHFIRYSFFSCKYFSIYKHIITKPDKEKHEHDHPWNFISFIWSGGYTELSNNKKYVRKRFSVKYFNAKHHHRILEIFNDRCITITITGKRFRLWGYPTEMGWIDNIKYRELKNNGEV